MEAERGTEKAPQPEAFELMCSGLRSSKAAGRRALKKPQENSTFSRNYSSLKPTALKGARERVLKGQVDVVSRGKSSGDCVLC